MMGGGVEDPEDSHDILARGPLREDPRLHKIRMESDLSADSSLLPKTIPEEIAAAVFASIERKPVERMAMD